MNWLEIVAIAILLVGVGAGGYLVAQRPSFWLGMAVVIVKALLPFITKRMPPEDEAAWRDCHRRNGKWNHRKRRCE